VSAGAHALDVATRPLQAASTAVAGQQRAAGALLAAPFSESARDTLASGLYEPQVQIAAALHKLTTGETPAGYEQPVAEGLDLLSQLYLREPLHPLVKEAVALGFDPLTYAPLEGLNKVGASALSRASSFASRVASDLPGISKAGDLVERASRSLADVHDPRVEELFNSGGRVLSLRPSPADINHFHVTVLAGDGAIERVDTASGELKQLEAATGAETHPAAPSLSRRALDGALDVSSLPRSVMTAADLSAPGRQGLIFTLTEPSAGLRAMGRQLRSAVSEGGHATMMAWLATHPDADLAEASGLYSAMKQGASLSGREEAFMSRLAERVPLVKRSERAYVAYLDSLRQDVFSKYARELQEAGLTFESNPEEFKSIARFINSATGRGELPAALEQFAPAMNATLFAPRNLKGRFDVLNPVFYKNLSPAARKIAMRKMVEFAGTVTGGMYLAHLAGAKVTLDPDDPDFGKVTVGKTHYDFTGGLRGPVRLVAQLGKTFATEHGNPVPVAAKRLALFLREQSAPPVNYAWAAATGKEINGEPFEPVGHLHRHGKFAPGGGVIDRVLYLSAQDLFDAWAEDGGRGVAKAAPAALLGVGVQTYAPKADRSSRR
jgi:hypothetical protein